MNEEIMFSIIIVTLNAEKEISDTIKSIEEQNYDNFEVIVKDGGSKDLTLSRIPKKEKYRIHTMKDQSVYEGMNQAIYLSKGKFIIFLNAGDSFASCSTLSETFEFIKNKRIEDMMCVLYGNYYRKDMGIQNQPCKITEFYLYRRPLCHQSLFYSRELFNKYGLYDVSYKISADHEYTMRLWTLQTPFLHTGNTVCTYEGGGISESKTGWETAIKERKKIREQYYSKLSRIKYDMILFLSFSKVRAWLDSDMSPRWLNRKYISIRNRSLK